MLFLGVCWCGIVGIGELTESAFTVNINILVDLSACGGTFFMHIYN